MKEFFPYEKVLNGLLKTVSNCFNLKIEEAADITTWHPDCKVYKIYELDNAKPVAIIYLDPFRR